MKKTVICKDKDGNKKEVPAKDLSWRPSVYGVIIRDGKVLLSKQWGGYDFPGGGVDLGETLKEGLIREIKEETGLDVQVGEIVSCENSFFTIPFENRHTHGILMHYCCDVIGGKLSVDNLDEYEKTYAEMAEWIDIVDIDKVEFRNSSESIKIIRDAEAKLKK